MTLQDADAAAAVPAETGDGIPLRTANDAGQIWLETWDRGLHVTLANLPSVMELCVNGLVYAETRGMILRAFDLSARVGGIEVRATCELRGLRATIRLLMDGEEKAEVKRFI